MTVITILIAMIEIWKNEIDNNTNNNGGIRSMRITKQLTILCTDNEVNTCLYYDIDIPRRNQKN